MGHVHWSKQNPGTDMQCAVAKAVINFQIA